MTDGGYLAALRFEAEKCRLLGLARLTAVEAEILRVTGADAAPVVPSRKAVRRPAETRAR